ncbi:hypothetical protein HPB47_018105, partial [Ixodes persulcatus]
DFISKDERSLRYKHGQGSQLLHQATYGKFYFKHVTIVLPSTWPQTSGRQVTGDSLFHRADIRVGDIPSGGSGSRPFTRHQRGCGERGEYIQVPTEFLVSLNLSSQAECGSPVLAFLVVLVSRTQRIPNAAVCMGHGEQLKSPTSSSGGAGSGAVPVWVSAEGAMRAGRRSVVLEETRLTPAFSAKRHDWGCIEITWKKVKLSFHRFSAR